MEPEPQDVAQLLVRIESGWSPDFLFFWGHSARPGAALGKECLSQWYPAPFIAEGDSYVTAEHFMMAQKAILFGDTQIAEQIRACRLPAEAKELGRRVRNFDEGRWAASRFHIIAAGSHAKFSQNPSLRSFLLGTGSRVLVEASPTDTIWGIGIAEKDPGASDPRRWRGRNLLGFALMHARARIAGVDPKLAGTA